MTNLVIFNNPEALSKYVQGCSVYTGEDAMFEALAKVQQNINEPMTLITAEGTGVYYAVPTSQLKEVTYGNR